MTYVLPNSIGIAYLEQFKRNPDSDQTCRKVDERLEARIIALTFALVLKDHGRWTIRFLADELKIEVGEEEAVDKKLSEAL